MDKREAEELIYNTDLRKTLSSKGVSPEHFDKLLERRFNNYSKEYLEATYEPAKTFVLYNSIGPIEPANIQAVAPSKIDGIDRIDRASDKIAKYNSILDIAQGSIDPRVETNGLNVHRMGKAFKHIVNDSIEELHSWYKERCKPVKLTYYLDDDIYRTTGDGSHRSLYSIIVNAPAIKAEVMVYKKNANNQKAFDYFEEMKKKYNITDINDCDIRAPHQMHVTFNKDNASYKVTYPGDIREGKSYKMELLKEFEKKVQDDLSVTKHKLVTLFIRLKMPNTALELVIRHLMKTYANANGLRIDKHINSLLSGN